jgi:hypothetical protein
VATLQLPGFAPEERPLPHASVASPPQPPIPSTPTHVPAPACVMRHDNLVEVVHRTMHYCNNAPERGFHP